MVKGLTFSRLGFFLFKKVNVFYQLVWINVLIYIQYKNV